MEHASNEVSEFASPDPSLEANVSKKNSPDHLGMATQTRELINILPLSVRHTRPDGTMKVHAAGSHPRLPFLITTVGRTAMYSVLVKSMIACIQGLLMP